MIYSKNISLADYWIPYNIFKKYEQTNKLPHIQGLGTSQGKTILVLLFSQISKYLGSTLY